MKVGLIQFPGLHGLDEARRAAQAVWQAEAMVTWHGEESLPELDLLIVPGGASFGDVLRPGALARASAIAPAIRRYAHERAVIGLGNGCQILCELGVLPGTFLLNRNGKFFGDTIRVASIDGEEFTLPIAATVGRYYAEPKTLREMTENQQIALTVRGSTGPLEIGDIVGFLNGKKNVFGTILRPDRDTHNSDAEGTRALRWAWQLISSPR